MSSQSFGTFNAPMHNSSSQPEGNALRGFFIGLIPLLLLIIVVASTYLLTAFARQLTASSGFFAQQQAAVIVLLAGFVVALVVSVVAIIVMMKRVKAWQQEGASRLARGMLLALGVTALVVLMPVVLAIVLPQHPAQ